MKSLILPLALAVLFTSCAQTANSPVKCIVSGKTVSIKNANTTLSVGRDLSFSVKYKENNVTAEKAGPSVHLTDSAGNKIFFTRTSANKEEINDEHGKGAMLKIESNSADNNFLCELSLSAYDSVPDAIIVRAVFRNLCGRKSAGLGYSLDNLSVGSPSPGMTWWSFQGAAYRWGLDFAFPLPETFKRENFMGLNALKAGAGIPVIDFWNRNFGIALACISSKPEYISLPVSAGNGNIDINIQDTLKRWALEPGSSFESVMTAIIVHEGDFYDPLKTYSHLVKPVLSPFQVPGDLSYQPEWCTWGYRQAFTPQNILSKIDTFKALGIKSVILDDGWSKNHGDWIPDPKKFPKGDEDYKKLVNTLHENDLKVWIWWLPGYVDSTSSIASEHQDWLIQNQDGSVHKSYGFCPAYTPVREHYKNLVRKFTEEYKLDGLKLDFGEINSAAPCYNPAHHHKDPYESYYSTPLLFKNIYETAKRYNPEMVVEYCSCSIPPNVYHMPYMNLAVTSDPKVSQVTRRIKMYKALIADDFPVLEEYCGVLSGPTYQLTVGAGGVPGTFSVYLDDYHKKWLGLYNEYRLSKGKYLNLYDIGFDYPEGHAIEKDGSMYYAFYTHPWSKIESKRWYRFGMEWDSQMKGKREIDFPVEAYSGKLELRGLDPGKKYQVLNYENDMDLGIIQGKSPLFDATFENYLLLKVTPLE